MLRDLGVCLVLLLVVGRYAHAQDDERIGFGWMPGAAREVDRGTSASRDTPVFEYAYGPKAYSTIGGEWGWFRVSGQSLSFRFGMYAMIPLENHDADWLFPPYEVWRGMAGISCAWSADILAARWFGKDGGVEGSLMFTHESDHAERLPHDPHDPGDIRGGTNGQTLTPDIALRIPVGVRLQLLTRVQCRVFIKGTLTAAPGADLIVRWRVTRKFALQLSTFAERLYARGADARDGHFIRCMLGPVFPGNIGEVSLFVSVDAGNGIGLLVNHRDVRYSAGMRYSPFAR